MGHNNSIRVWQLGLSPVHQLFSLLRLSQLPLGPNRPRPQSRLSTSAQPWPQSRLGHHSLGLGRLSLGQLGLSMNSVRPQSASAPLGHLDFGLGSNWPWLQPALPRPLLGRPRPGIFQVGLALASSRSATDSSTPAPSFRLGPNLEHSSSAPASSIPPQPRPRAFLLGPGLEPSASAPASSILLGPGLERPALAPASSVPPRPQPRAFLLGPGLELPPRPRLLQPC